MPLQIRRRSPNPAVAVMEMRYQVALPSAEPQNILEEIVWHKEEEVDQWRERLPLLELRKQIISAPPTRDFLGSLRQAKTQPAVIAEVKKASPSKGVIRPDFDPVAIAQAYEQGGASCLSVLTDAKFFQGSLDHLTQIRQAVSLPLLCKDFILYPYQIYLARLRGADAVLLIAALLTNQDLSYFIKIAQGIGMTALVEVHTLEELDRILAVESLHLVGINNRNLEDFSVDLQTTTKLLAEFGAQLADRQIPVVSESGLYTQADLQQVSHQGAQAVLIGESLMRQPDPGQALAQLLHPN